MSENGISEQSPDKSQLQSTRCANSFNVPATPHQTPGTQHILKTVVAGEQGNVDGTAWYVGEMERYVGDVKRQMLNKRILHSGITLCLRGKCDFKEHARGIQSKNRTLTNANHRVEDHFLNTFDVRAT